MTSKIVISLVVLGIGLAFIWNCSTTSSTDEGDILIIPKIIPTTWYGEPHWSPNGQWIVYSWYKGIADSICLVRPDGSERKSVARGHLPAFSPDGTEISTVIGTQIFIYNLVSDSYKQLTFEEQNHWPRWSPDGKLIVYDSNLSLPSKGNVIWIMNADGSNKKDISIHEVGEWRFPRWTPDYKIVYSWAFASGWQLFMMDSTGQNHKKLTKEWDSILPDISSDGLKIVYEVFIRSENERGIWIMDIDGGHKRKLTLGIAPSFSPDGNKIVFARNGIIPEDVDWDVHDPIYRGSLWIYELDTGNEYQILP